MKKITRLKVNQSGFSLPELSVVLVVTAMFVGLIMQFGISYWRYGLTLEADSDTLVTRLNIQDYLRENIDTSSGLIIQNSIADNSALNPDTSIAGENYWQKIHAVPAGYSTGGTGTTPLIYYKRYSLDSSKAIIMNGSFPYEDEYVIYLDNSKKQLLVRSLANPNATGNRLKTTCAPVTATPGCPADKVIADNLASVSMKYFSRSGNPLDWTSVYDANTGTYIGPDFPSVEVAEFTVKLAAKPGFEKTNTTQNTTIVRIALRNT